MALRRREADAADLAVETAKTGLAGAETRLDEATAANTAAQDRSADLEAALGAAEAARAGAQEREAECRAVLSELEGEEKALRAETAALETQGTAPAAAAPPASDMTQQAEASGAPAPDSTSGKPPLWGRGPDEREKTAERPEAVAETPGSAAEDTQEGAASDAARADLPTAADAKAGAKARQKGGRKLKLFLLLLCLVVIALFAAAVLTGRFEPGGIVPASKAPSTRDVAPPASDIGIPGSRLAPAERGGPLIGRVQ